ncbi:hypothetical protein ANS014_14490 [Paraclostridium bifermentans]|nr:hypothetical protein ANS014_14490 [Paraclostridium bifermentans]
MKKLKFNYTKLILIFICIYVLSNILSGIIKKKCRYFGFRKSSCSRKF